MTKNEYMKTLRTHLRNMSEEDKDAACEFYNEYFEDAGEDNEQEVIKELGVPEKLARKINAESVIKGYEQNKEQNKEQERKTAEKKASNVKTSSIKDLWILLLAIFASPVWMPLGIAAAAVVFGLIIAFCSILFAFAATGVGIVVGGIAALVVSIFSFSVSVPAGILGLGISFILMAFGLLILFACIEGIRCVFGATVRTAKNKIRKGEKQND